MLLSSPDKPPKDPKWKQSPVSRYAQLWHQLCIVICHTYCPSPASDSITIPLVPPSPYVNNPYRRHMIFPVQATKGT